MYLYACDLQYNPFIAVRNNHIDGGVKHVIFNLHLFSLMAALRLKPLAKVKLKSENVVFNQFAANHTLFFHSLLLSSL